jgi:hypothetical protein
MALNVNNILVTSLYDALLALQAPAPISGTPTNVSTLMSDEQKAKVLEYINVFITQIVNEIVTKAEVSIKMTEHTHNIPTMAVIGGGGGSVGGITTGTQAVTDAPNEEIEIGDPTSSTGGIT